MNNRDHEIEKYTWAYKNQKQYRMAAKRKEASLAAIAGCPLRGSYLDVSCGQGDMLDAAREIGFKRVMGTEVVKQLLIPNKVLFAYAHDLPFSPNEFQVVSMFDVIEHLPRGDDEQACRELDRVASKRVILTASNGPSFNKRGDDLHINKRPYEEWDALFREWFTGSVEWVGLAYKSQLWRVWYE